MKKMEFGKGAGALVAGCLAASVTLPVVAADVTPSISWDLTRLAAPQSWEVDDVAISNDCGRIEGVRPVWIEGEEYCGKPTRIFAWWGLPENAGEGRKVPAMVLVHGGGGTAFASWVKTWNDRGYAAIAMDTCGGAPHGERDGKPHPRHAWSGPYGWQDSRGYGCGGLKDEWPYQAVSAVIRCHSFLRNRPEVDAAHVGLTGISWGGYLTSIVMGVDGRFAFAAPVYGCGWYDLNDEWEKVFRNSKWNAEAKGDVSTRLNYGRWLRDWDARNFVGGTRCPVLRCNGTRDLYYTAEMTERSTEALPQGTACHLSIKNPMPHGHAPAGDPKEIAAWADYYLKGGPKPLEIVCAECRDGRLVVRFRGNDDRAVAAELLYTTDSNVPNKDRAWQVCAAAESDLADGEVGFPVPQQTKLFFANVRTAKGEVYSTRLLALSRPAVTDRVEYAQFLNDFSELSFDAEGRLRLPKVAPPVLVPVVECFLKSGSEACATNEEVVFACETAGVARAQNAVGVDPFIGTSGLGHVTPAAAAPFGMVQAGPDTSGNPGRFVADWAHTGGYQHGDEWLWRFSQTHISGTGCSSLGDFGLLPYVDGFDGATNPARMVKETERAEPGFYAVVLDENGARIGCEVSALAHSAVYRFLYPKGKRVKMLLDLDWGMGDVWKSGCWGRRVEACECVFTSERSVRGGRRMWNWNDYRVYFAMEFSAPVVTRRKLRDADGVRGEAYEIDFGISENGVLEVRLGLSFGSSEAAAKNLAAEMPRFDFAAARMKSTADWNEVLSRVELAAGTSDAVAKSFRSALYRTMFQPNLVSDVGDPPRYSTFSLWDTFRAAHPLYTLVAAERVADFVNSMLDQYDRQGYLPIWAIGGNDNHCMIGHHAVPVIADAYLKGIKGVDWVRAFAAVKNSLTINHKAANEGTWGLLKEDWDLLDKYGYYPFDLMRGEYGGKKVKGESVARLLECAYDDACAARMAEGLGKATDAAFFHKRSSNWRNGFDPAVGFMRGKDSSGQWREPFDPYALGMGPWRDNDFCEGNSWQYSWHVMQDVDGLVAALGGKTDALRRLDRLFAERPPDQFKDGDAHDVSGAIGQYVHGNEPSHHIAYFYSLLGRADRTAEVVRRIFDTQYFSRPDGLCGNDDCGQMAAWYVFSALGFYPFDPCGGEYVIGAPQVPKVTLNLANGKALTMTAKNLSKENKYVKSVTLNGKLIVDWKIRHAEVLKGGKLVFEMVGNLAGIP